MRTGGENAWVHSFWSVWGPLKTFQRHPMPSFQDLSTSHALPPPCRELGPLSSRQDASLGLMGHGRCCKTRVSPVSHSDALWYHPLAVSLDRQLSTIQMLLLPFFSSTTPSHTHTHDLSTSTTTWVVLPPNNIFISFTTQAHLLNVRSSSPLRSPLSAYTAPLSKIRLSTIPRLLPTS